MAEYTFKQFQDEYPNDAACLARIMEIQYGGDETECPVCDKRMQFHPMGKRRAYACQGCGHHIYPCGWHHLSQEPHQAHCVVLCDVPLDQHSARRRREGNRAADWRDIQVRLAHLPELRKLMAAADARGPIGGKGKHVEADETLVGGRLRHHGKGKHRVNKTTVFGMVERDGRLRAGPVPDETKFTLEGIVEENVIPGTTISTDGHYAYRDLGENYEHESVNHDAKEYVRGVHHTNTIEGHWSLLKRAIKGTHVYISSKHAWKYIAEFSYRRNIWPAPGSADTELGVLMEPEVCHGETEVYARVQA